LVNEIAKGEVMAMTNEYSPNVHQSRQNAKERTREQPTTRDGKTGSLAEGKYAQQVDIRNVAATSKDEVEERPRNPR
jgi:hypothetical protein